MPADETRYFIENAKSARAACKKCKVKIEKGELRVGVSIPDGRTQHLMTR
jgi:PHP family Zn ribbon phosphoesterase